MIELSQKIEAQKRIALRNKSRNNWILVVAAVIGFILAGIWIMYHPDDHEGTVVGVWLALSISMGLIYPFIFLRKTASQCPKCGSNWDMLSFKKTIETPVPKCSGCGLDLMD